MFARRSISSSASDVIDTNCARVIGLCGLKKPSVPLTIAKSASVETYGVPQYVSGVSANVVFPPGSKPAVEKYEIFGITKRPPDMQAVLFITFCYFVEYDHKSRLVNNDVQTPQSTLALFHVHTQSVNHHAVGLLDSLILYGTI